MCGLVSGLIHIWRVYFASDLDIDHFVPLYNAYLRWLGGQEKKTDFANNIKARYVNCGKTN